MLNIASRAVCLFLLAFASMSQAQESAPPPVVASTSADANVRPPESSSSRDGFEVSIHLSKDSAIPKQLSGTVTVKNTTTDRAMVISALHITPYGQLSGIYKPVNLRSTEIEIAPQTTKYFQVVFERDRKPTVFEHMTFRSASTDFFVRLQFFPLESESSSTTEFVVSPAVATSNVYVFLGGLCGAVLLISFILASKILSAARNGQLIALFPQAKPLLLKWLLLGAAYAVNGFIVALLLVILASGLSTFQIPISFKLQDFSGGLIVGLFSVTLGKFLSEKLSLT